MALVQLAWFASSGFFVWYYTTSKDRNSERYFTLVATILPRGYRSIERTSIPRLTAAPRYVIRDRDKKYGEEFVGRLESFGVKQVLISTESP